RLTKIVLAIRSRFGSVTRGGIQREPLEGDVGCKGDALCGISALVFGSRPARESWPLGGAGSARDWDGEWRRRVANGRARRRRPEYQRRRVANGRARRRRLPNGGAGRSRNRSQFGSCRESKASSRGARVPPSS